MWVALNFDRHVHHPAARRWYESLSLSETLVFCRQTQLGLFRILTTAAVMGTDVRNQPQCWTIFDRWVDTRQVAWADEPPGLQELLRGMTTEPTASPKAWMDAYLSAFAEGSALTLITFDRSLARKAKGALLLD